MLFHSMQALILIYIFELLYVRWMITSNTKYINERVTYLLKNGVLVGIKPI